MQKGHLLGEILEQQEAEHEGVWNVTTSQRRDVPTSRRPNVATSPRHDVGSTTMQVNKRQRRDVSTSRSCNVATSARDLPSIIKSKRGSELEASGNVRTRARKSERQR